METSGEMRGFAKQPLPLRELDEGRQTLRFRLHHTPAQAGQAIITPPLIIKVCIRPLIGFFHEFQGEQSLDGAVEGARAHFDLALRALRDLLHDGIPMPLAVHERHDTSSLNAVVTGGGPVDDALAATAADLFADDVLAVTYGAAETGEVSVDGHVLDGVDVEIVDGVIHVVSPLAAGGRATAGDRGRLDADGLLHLTM